MDPLSRLLQGVHASGAVLHRSILEPPWSLRIDEGAQLTVAAALSGEAWVVFDDGEQGVLRPGELAILRTDEAYTVANPADTPVQLVVTRAGAALPDGTLLPAPPDPLTCTIDDSGSTVLISGNYVVAGDLSGRVLAPLPRLAKVALSGDSLLLEFLVQELGRPGPGQQAALDRWLDLALVTAVRGWFESQGSAPGWYVAQSDPVVGPTLQAIHDDPAQGWSVATLARVAGVSRTAFTARFTRLVGEPPMAYVTGVRLDTAADRLRTSDDTLAKVATEVGYASPFALSAAMKRQRGLRPTQLRARARVG